METKNSTKTLLETLYNSIWAETLTPKELAQVCAESYEVNVNAGAHLTRIGEAATGWFGD